MSLEKPYYRIFRPFSENGGAGTDYDYLLDKDYANNRFELCRAYNIIVNDFKKALEYIEPSDDNLKVYSLRLYELLLRAATECENNFTIILKDNDYNIKNEKDWNIKDYYLINKSSKLSDYEVKLNFWKPAKILKPFNDWEESHILNWYQEYNCVKHNRYDEFQKANLGNVLKAVAGLFVVLFSQFETYAFNGYQDNDDLYEDPDSNFLSSSMSIFSIKRPKFKEEEKYAFNWVDIRKNSPFNKFDFNSLKEKNNSNQNQKNNPY